MTEYTTEFILLVGMLAQLLGGFIDKREREREFKQERDEWNKERQMLLDRIQAPTFAEYTAKVVKEKKAEQPQEEEKPVEFVS